MVDSDKESCKQNDQYPDSYSGKIVVWMANCHYYLNCAALFPKTVRIPIFQFPSNSLSSKWIFVLEKPKIILVVLTNTQVEASQESFQHDIHILQPSAYNFEARQTTAQPSIFADIDEVYVHLEYASFFSLFYAAQSVQCFGLPKAPGQ